MSMVERIARAIYDTSPGGKSWADAIAASEAPITFANSVTRDIARSRVAQCRAAARAAIEAMREPTPTMLRAAVDNDNGDVYGETGFIGNLKIMWGSAISAALNEQEG